MFGTTGGHCKYLCRYQEVREVIPQGIFCVRRPVDRAVIWSHTPDVLKCIAGVNMLRDPGSNGKVPRLFELWALLALQRKKTKERNLINKLFFENNDTGLTNSATRFPPNYHKVLTYNM